MYMGREYIYVVVKIIKLSFDWDFTATDILSLDQKVDNNMLLDEILVLVIEIG